MSAPPDLPDVVRRAFDVSRRAGFVSFCRNETGRLLAALAATRRGTLGEVGTGGGGGGGGPPGGVRPGVRRRPRLAAKWHTRRRAHPARGARPRPRGRGEPHL